jgi:hypothetical protein
MAGQKTIATTFIPPPSVPTPPPVADYHVTGINNPDVTGNYFLAGTFCGKPYYKREDDGFYLFWTEEGAAWRITDNLDEFTDNYFWREEATIEGLYFLGGAWTGTATVTAGPA